MRLPLDGVGSHDTQKLTFVDGEPGGPERVVPGGNSAVQGIVTQSGNTLIFSCQERGECFVNWSWECNIEVAAEFDGQIIGLKPKVSCGELDF